MQIENQTCAYLLALLRCALTGAPAPAVPEGLDFDAFFDLARRQQIYNIVFPLLAALPGVPEGEKKRWENYTYTELTRTITMDHERGQLFARLDEAGIDYMPLKGLLLREYYPKTSMRQMTDNDILYDPTGREQLLRIMRKAGYKMTACGENSDDFHKPPYATFEFHRTLFFDEKDFCPRFDGLWHRATRDPDHPHAFVMDVSDNYLYTVAHMYKHYSTNGCGVRFLADVYLLYTKENARLDWPYMEAEFRKMGILDFARLVQRLALDLFEDRELDPDEMQMLTVCMQGGVFGDSKLTLVRRLNAQGAQLSGSAQRRRYMWRRLFPDKKKMHADFKALDRHPWLLPWFYLLRFLRLPFKRKAVLAETRQVQQLTRQQEKK